MKRHAKLLIALAAVLVVAAIPVAYAIAAGQPAPWPLAIVGGAITGFGLAMILWT